MKIGKLEVSVREIANGYKDNNEEGVVGYGGKLNIRPKYQREFIYKDKQRDAVIETIRKGFPLNVMYWIKNEDGTFEVLDGQQRTISFCSYVNGDYSIDNKSFCNLTDTERELILNYKADVYVCEGNDKERLDWFRIINIAGEKLTEQELLNANYTGEWLTDAKYKFSKKGCVAYLLANKYVKGSPIRQEYLETALDWISGGYIAKYMDEHCKDSDANELWDYFQEVISWIERLFPNYRNEMKGLPWGRYYNQYKDNSYNSDELESEIKRLRADDDVTKLSGIYPYLLSNKEDEKYLSIRTFLDNQKQKKYDEQGGICPICGKHFEIDEMEGDHIIPWKDGGKTVYDNLQMLCKHCNRTKSGK